MPDRPTSIEEQGVPNPLSPRELARLLIAGVSFLDLEGQPYNTVATLYHVRDELALELEKFDEEPADP